MSKLVLRLLINMAALYAAFFLLDGNGLTVQSGGWVSLLWLAVIFGLVNALIRPFLMVVGCPFIVATLGLGTLLVNTLLFYLAGLIGSNFGVGFTVDGFWPAFLGALIVSVVSFVLSVIFGADRKGPRPRKDD
jgi:putative membrane protein